MERLTWGEMVREEPLIIVDKQKDTIGLANTHSRTILTIARAADTLAKAVSFFQELPQTTTLSSSEFIRGAFYYAEFLLRRPLRVLKRDLEHARTTTTTFKQSEHIADGPVTVDSLLDAATDAVKDLFILLEASCDSKLGSQSKVPVVNPYESLGCVLCEQPEVCRALEDPAYDDKKLLTLVRQSWPFTAGDIPGRRGLSLDVVPDGVPKTFFACVHRVDRMKDKRKILFGSSCPNWHWFHEVGKITRQQRDKQLKRYLKPANAAMKALREYEDRFAEQMSGPDLSAEEVKLQSRKQAIRAMHEEGACLGEEDVYGMAFRHPGCEVVPLCYVCKGMTRYKEFDRLAPDEEDRKITNFGWKLRKSACACAEAVPMAQWHEEQERGNYLAWLSSCVIF